MTRNPTNPTPAPNPNLLPGGSFFEALAEAYCLADRTNRAALEFAFPTLRAALYRHDWDDSDPGAPAVCASCGCEESRTVTRNSECDTIRRPSTAFRVKRAKAVA